MDVKLKTPVLVGAGALRFSRCGNARKSLDIKGMRRVTRTRTLGFDSDIFGEPLFFRGQETVI
jgi:hypothetical protein